MEEREFLRSTTSPDMARYGKRLHDYLLAQEKITYSLSSPKIDEFKDIDSLMREILPALQQGFNSKKCFFTDENRKIIFAYPSENDMAGKQVPGTKRIKELANMGDCIIIDRTSKYPTELDSLGVDSLILIRMETGWKHWFVGIADGENKPSPYLSEDKKFFSNILKILTLGYNNIIIKAFGKIETELKLSSERYLKAQLRGEWQPLSQASEHYARAFQNSDQFNGPQKYGKDKEKLDEILADFLDAELCWYIQSSPKITNVKENSIKKPWERFELSYEGKFKVILSGIKEEDSEALEISEYPRTALAITRICLFVENSKKEITSQKVNDKGKDGQSGQTKLIEGFCGYTKSKLKYMIPGKVNWDETSSFDRCLHWTRTLWQDIYYNARKGTLEPLEEYITKINGIYTAAWETTVKVLKEYLEHNSCEDDLRIDSDWLITWLTSNMLLSKGLNEYYKLNVIQEEEKKGETEVNRINPISRMRYLRNLSHNVLYVIHCIRHAKRKDISEKNTNANDDEDNHPKTSGDKKKDESPHKNKIEDSKRFPFADVPFDPTASLSQSQLYILSEYAYREIGIHRELDIFDRLSRQLRYELPLYAASSYYRDHLYHVMDVCLLGELLLRSMIFKKGIGNKKYNLLLTTISSNKEFDRLLRNWYVAALCHDLGYVIEQSEKLLSPIKEIKGEGLTKFSEELEKGIEEGKKKIQKAIKEIEQEPESYVVPAELLEKLTDIDVSIDHGVAAWLHLRKWIQDTSLNLQDFEPALTAILRHNLTRQKIDIKKEPLSFLLLLCDHIQEWGRPRVGPDPLARGVMEGLRFSEKIDFDKKIRAARIIIKGLKPKKIQPKDVLSRMCDRCFCGSRSICTDKCLLVRTGIIKKTGIEFTLPHTESREADFEPCISWLLFCKDLQSINYKMGILPFPLSIVFKHDPARIWHELNWSPKEMDIFEEYANRYSSYLCEWIEFAREKKEGIKYEVEEKSGQEIFTINLHKLKQPLKRDLLEEHWQPFIRWKWQWLSQKYAVLNLGPWFPEQK